MRYWKWALLALAWAGGVSSGLWALFDYERTPSAVAVPPDRWPGGSQLSADQVRPTFIMFVHPHCPCSRASLDELMLLATHRPGLLNPIVVFPRPRGVDAGWEKTDLWQSAQTIPGATIFCDVDGTESARFKARVSGESLLYDAAGTLLFHGGITGSRGHRGDNPGRSAVESLLAGTPVRLRRTPVFGCSLLDRPGIPRSPESDPGTSPAALVPIRALPDLSSSESMR